MKLLIITRSAWDDSSCIGNSMSNIFSNWSQNKLANIFFRSGKPDNKICTKYFSISEMDLLKCCFKRDNKAGRFFEYSNMQETFVQETIIKTENKLYSFFRNNPSAIALWFQDFLWRIGNWKNSNLIGFLHDFKPDVIFSPCFNILFTHRVLWYLKKNTGAKVVLYHADNYISSRTSFLLSPSYLYAFFLSRAVINSAKNADINYCISNKMQDEYEKITGKTMGILFKGANFSGQPVFKSPKNVIKIVYTGTIYYGRWRTLSMLANTINKINNETNSFELDIYSQHQPTEKILYAMTKNSCSKFMGKISSDQVSVVQKEADIVLHVESFEEKEKITTRLSFSTKIVDCFKSGSCVMAIGWQEAASIDYLIKNDAAIVATNEEEILKQLKKIANNPLIIIEYAKKAWDCGKKNHQIDEIQKRLFKDLESLVKEKSD